MGKTRGVMSVKRDMAIRRENKAAIRDLRKGDFIVVKLGNSMDEYKRLRLKYYVRKAMLTERKFGMVWDEAVIMEKDRLCSEDGSVFVDLRQGVRVMLYVNEKIIVLDDSKYYFSK